MVGREDVTDPVVTSEAVPGISVAPGAVDASEGEVPETVEVVWSSAVVAGTGATLVALGREEVTDSVAVAVTVEDPVLVTGLLPVGTSIVLGTGV